MRTPRYSGHHCDHCITFHSPPPPSHLVVVMVVVMAHRGGGVILAVMVVLVVLDGQPHVVLVADLVGLEEGAVGLHLRALVHLQVSSRHKLIVS